MVNYFDGIWHNKFLFQSLSQFDVVKKRLEPSYLASYLFCLFWLELKLVQGAQEELMNGCKVKAKRI